MDGTPGPWATGSIQNKRGWRDHLMVYGSDGVLVANCEAPKTDTRHYARPTGEDEANAKLIAAAPDLFRALDRFLGDECECNAPGAIGPCAYCEGWDAYRKATE